MEVPNWLHRRHTALNLVLLDLDLPRKNGDEVLEELHEDPKFPSFEIPELLRPKNISDILERPIPAIFGVDLVVARFTNSLEVIQIVQPSL